jgi:hypothetical protein
MGAQKNQRSVVCLSFAICAVFACSEICTARSLGQTAAVPQTTAAVFQEEVIAEITPGNEYKSAIVGDLHLAWVENQGGKRVVRLDGKQQGGIYDDVKYPEFNSDESHLAFFAKRSSAWILVLDGQERPGEYSKVAAVSFQPKGNSYAFCACKEKKCRLVIDGVESGDEYTDISSPAYSRDGKRLAYLGKKGKKWIAVVDGKELGPELDDFWYSDWGFSREGAHFFVAARIGGKWKYVIDGQMGLDFEVLSPIVFSPDGMHYSYGGIHVAGGFKKQKTIGDIVLDGKTFATYEGKGMAGSWTMLGGSTQMIVTGVRDLTPDFHGVSTPEFDSQGKLIYIARRDKGDNAVFVGADAGPGFDEVLSPVAFSSDSQHFAYVARQGANFVEVRDNVSGRSFASSRRQATGVQWISMNRDATHLAYETVSGGMQYQAGETARALRSVVIDGQVGPEYDALGIGGLRFAKDALHYLYEVHGLKSNHDLVNVDGQESSLYDFVIRAHFLDDGKTATFIARNGSKFLRVSLTLK